LAKKIFSGGVPDLTDPQGYAGANIAGFIAGDAIDLAGAWQYTSFSENAAGTIGTLTLTSGANQVALDFAGSFSASSFNVQSGATTVIGHT
jgi:hypothetical protein